RQFPIARQFAEVHHLDGGGTLLVAANDSDDANVCVVTLDLTPLRFECGKPAIADVPAETTFFRKTSGVPCSVEAAFRVVRQPDQANSNPRMVRWDLDKFRATLAASHAEATRGVVSFDNRFIQRAVAAASSGDFKPLLAGDLPWQVEFSSA